MFAHSLSKNLRKYNVDKLILRQSKYDDNENFKYCFDSQSNKLKFIKSLASGEEKISEFLFNLVSAIAKVLLMNEEGR
jgi:hypothetical protein